MTRSRTATSPPIHRISGPGELLQAVPYLLGFHPQRSLVLVGLRDNQLIVTARLDLVDAAGPEVIANALAAIVRGGTTSVVAAVYDDAVESAARAGERPWSDVGADLAREAERAGCRVLDILLVAGGRRWSLSCPSPDCCPVEGQPLPNAPSAYAAAATYAGVVPLADRDELAASLAPLPACERERLDAQVEAAEHATVAAILAGGGSRHERRVTRALHAAARASDEPGWLELGEAEVGRFGAALGVTAVRDSLWLAIDDRRLSGRPLWRDLARRLPSPYDAAPLFLFGWAAWRNGDGALAGIAAERAIESSPAYTAADLLLGALSCGIDPHQLPRLKARPSRSRPSRSRPS